MSDIIEQEVKPLTLVERNNLQYHEQVVERGRSVILDMTESLVAIIDGRLYRETHDYADLYLRERWGLSYKAYQNYKLARTTILQLEDANDQRAGDMPMSQAADLGYVDADLRPAVLDELDRIKASGEGHRKPMREAIKRVKAMAGIDNQAQPSIAMQKAAEAVKVLAEIPFNDPMSKDAYRKVINYCQGRML